MALSRARLGLYILGRREVFEACYELKPAFELLLQRPDKLTLATGEMWPSERVLADEVAQGEENTVAGEAVMEGVEHLGQYVFEMTSARVKQLRAERGLPDAEVVEVAEEDMKEEEMTYDDQQDDAGSGGDDTAAVEEE